MKKAVVIISGGLDSICTAAYLRSKYDLYGISFSYGQRANQELKVVQGFARYLGLKKHKVVDISFMKDLYGKTNVLTDFKKRIPSRFDYSIVVPIRNAIFLTIASGWAFSLGAQLVAFGAHKGDQNYPDCRPSFSRKLQSALNEGEADGIQHGFRRAIKVWSPFSEGFSKSDLLRIGYKILGERIFKTWSCYSSKKIHCGSCESCVNRKLAFKRAKIRDKTKYLK